MDDEKFMKEQELIIHDLSKKLILLKRQNIIRIAIFGVGYWLWFLSYISHLIK